MKKSRQKFDAKKFVEKNHNPVAQRKVDLDELLFSCFLFFFSLFQITRQYLQGVSFLSFTSTVRMNLRDRSTLTPVVRYGEQLRLSDYCTYTTVKKEAPHLPHFQQVIVPPHIKGVRYGANNQRLASDSMWERHQWYLTLNQ